MSIHWPETGAEKTGSGDTLQLAFPFGSMKKPPSTGSVVGFWMRLDTRFANTTLPQTILARQAGLSGGNDAYLRLNGSGTLAWGSRLGGGTVLAGGTPSAVSEEVTYLVMQIVTADRVHIVFAEPGQTPVVGTEATSALYNGSPDGEGGIFQYIACGEGPNVRPFAGGEISDVFMLHGDFPEVGTEPDTTVISDIADGTLAISDIAAEMTGSPELRLHYPLRHRTDFSDASPQGLRDLILNQPQDYETGIVFTSRGPLRPETLMPDHIGDCPAPLVFETPGDISTAKVPLFRVEGGTYSGPDPSAIEARLIKEDGTDHVTWTTVDPAPSGGTWQQYDFTNVPAVKGYLEVEFRAVDGGGSQIGDAVRSHGLRGTGFCVLNSQAQSQLEQNWTTPSAAFSLPLGIRLTTSKFGSNSHVMMHSSRSRSTRGFRLGIGQMAREIHNQYPGYPIHIATVAEGGTSITEFIGAGPYQPRFAAMGARYGIEHPGHTLLLMGHSNSGGAGNRAEYANNTLAIVAEHEAAMGPAGKVVLCPTPRYKGTTGFTVTTLQIIRDAMWDVYQTDTTKFVWAGSFASLVSRAEQDGSPGSDPHPSGRLDGQGRGGSLMAFATLAAHGALPGPLEIVSATDVGDGIELGLSELSPALEAITPSVRTAPSITGLVAPGLTITLNEGTYVGTGPTTVSKTLTLDGSPVVISGGQYTIPSGTAGQSLVYSETPSNDVGTGPTQSVTSTVESFPSRLFGVGDKGFAHDLMDLSGANTLSDQTGTTPGAGDPLGYLPDLSPNGKTATQSVTGERPLVQTDANSRNYLSFDSDDLMATTEDLADDTWTFWMVFEPTREDFIALVNPDEGGPWVGIGRGGGNTSTNVADLTIEFVQYWYDSTPLFRPTRGESSAEAQNSNLLILEMETGSASWPEAGIGDYNNSGSSGPPGDVYAWGAINRPLTVAERAELLTYANQVRGA